MKKTSIFNTKITKLPNLNMDLFNGEKTTLFENNFIEYKQNMSDGISRNIHETICAFLNRNGGYIIIGVADDLSIKGINIKFYDRFISNTIDSIYNQGMIVHGEHGVIIDPFLISHYTHTTKNKKILLVIKIISDLPEITKEYRSHYRIKTGWSFFRLNCSNLKTKNSERLYLFNEASSFKVVELQGKNKKLEEKNEKLKQQCILMSREISNLQVEKEILEQEKKRYDEHTILSAFLSKCFNFMG